MKVKNNYYYNSENGTANIIIFSKGIKYDVIVDDHSMPGLCGHRWCLHSKGYVETVIEKKHILMHRYLMDSELSKGLQVDHINHNKLDNRLSNLRVVTSSQNHYNQTLRVNSHIKYKGVERNNKDNIIARISCDGVKHYLGAFKTEEEAAIAYDKKAIELFGEYANINFPKVEA